MRAATAIFLSDADGAVLSERPAGTVGDFPHVAVRVSKCSGRPAPISATGATDNGARIIRSVRSLVGAAAIIGTLILTATSSAAVRSCRPAFRNDSSLRISGGNCGLARGLERWVGSHESLDGSFVALRDQWLGAADRAGLHFKYVSPGWPDVEVLIASKTPHN
jgi:hypothetical protein